MDRSLSEIRTHNVVVEVCLGHRETTRIRLAKTIVEAALAGDERAQKRLCIIVKSSLNKQGGNYSWIPWNPAMLVNFFQDGHETPLQADDVFPSRQEYYEALRLFNLLPKPVKTSYEVLCECVPSSV
ncbi:MAG: hypothetical protein U0516_04335 [Candidatus Saccharibacteria bacterium]